MSRVYPIAAGILCCALSAAAQTGAPPAIPTPGNEKLAFLIANFVQAGTALLPPELRFFAFQTINPSFASLNSAIATQLSNLPVPSPASAIRLGPVEKGTGVTPPMSRSLGPVLAERADTIGKGKLLASITFQRFLFDRIDDLDWRSFEFNFPFPTSAGQGLINAGGDFSLDIAQTTAYFTYGITDWLDASYAIPFVTSTFSFRIGASITDPVSRQRITLLPASRIRGSATGFGDGIVRVKAAGRKLDTRHISTALVLDVRVPTGDELNYHGAGAYGIKPFLAVSFFRTKLLSPHINAGYQWNGKSFLASPNGSEKQQLPGQAFCAIGLDAGVSDRFTLAFDFIDQIVLNAQRTILNRGTTDTGLAYNTVSYPTNTRQELNVAAGFKARLNRKRNPLDPEFVVTGNLLLRVNESGLRARVIPMFGLSYVF